MPNLIFLNIWKKKEKKAVKGISVIKKLNVNLPRSSLLTISKSLIRLQLDYGDVSYDQPKNNKLSEKNESIQHKAALAITGAIRRRSREKLYQELGLEPLKDRRWLRRLCYLHKVLSTKLPTCLYELIPPIINSHCCYRTLHCRADLFRNSYLPFSINKWNKLNPDIRNLDSHVKFHKKLLNFIRPFEKRIFNVYDPQGFNLHNRLRLGFSHLGEHNFRHNFADTMNRLCPSPLETVSSNPFFCAAKIMYHFAQSCWLN